MAKLVLTVGSWDIPHMGHAKYLYMASQLGDLVVGVNTDAYINRYKGQLPVFTYSERVRLITSLPFVSAVIPNGKDDLKPMLNELTPDILCIGSDWGLKYYKQAKIDQEYLDTIGTVFVVLPRTPKISSSLIKERLHGRSN